MKMNFFCCNIMEKFCCDCFFNKKHNVVYDNNETELTNYNIYTEKNKAAFHETKNPATTPIKFIRK